MKKAKLLFILILLFCAASLFAQDDAAKPPASEAEAAEKAAVEAEEKARIARIAARKQDLTDLFEKFKSKVRELIANQGRTGSPAVSVKCPAGCEPKDDSRCEMFLDESAYFVGDRIYKFPNGCLPKVFSALKCSEYDYRVFRMCPTADFFEANARVYFDNGTDEEDEVDLFKNGNVEPALQFAAIRLPFRFGRADAFDPWSWGPELSAGLGTPAQAEDADGDKSTAPIVLVSVGLRLTYKITDEGSNFAFEVGRAFGFSTDEAFGDNDDSATYVGIKIKYVPAKKDSK